MAFSGRRLLVAGVLVAWVLGTTWIARATRRGVVATTCSVALLLLGVCFGPGSHVHQRVGFPGDRLTTRDGRTYVALGRQLIDRLDGVARVDPAGLLRERLVVLDFTERTVGESGARYLPARLAPREGTFLEECPDGTLALVAHDRGATWDEHGALLAYAPDGTSVWLPPFALFRADDVGEEAALAADAAAHRSVRHSPRLRLAESQLIDALGHESAWVRHAAATLIRAGGPEVYPDAVRRLDAFPPAPR